MNVLSMDKVGTVFLLALAAVAGKREEVFFDSTTYTSLNWDTYTATDRQMGWQEEPHFFKSRISTVYKVCDHKQPDGADSWVTTPRMETNGSDSLWLRVEYSIKVCKDEKYPECSLGIYLHQTHNSVISPLHSDWELIREVNATELKTDQNPKVHIGEIETNLTLDPRKEYVSIGFRDHGSCSRILSVLIFARYCTNTTGELVLFPDTLTMEDSREVEGQCVPNAKAISSPIAVCTRDGEWALPSTGCECEEGYTALGKEGCTVVSAASSLRVQQSLPLILCAAGILAF